MLLLVVACLFCLPGHSLAADKALIFGLLPSESPVALFKRFAPLREYLQERLKREVRLETARDFSEYSQRTKDRAYDIVFTAPHMAIQHLDSGVYKLAAKFNKPLKAVIVVSDNSSVQDLSDLKGRRFATPPQQAIVTMVGSKHLEKNGLFESKSTRMSAYRSHNAAYRAAIAGEVDAAIIANFIFIKAKKQKIGIRKISESVGFPGIGILIASDVKPSLRKDIMDVFVKMKGYAKGRDLLRKVSLPGFTEADPSEFDVLRPFVLNSK